MNQYYYVFFAVSFLIYFLIWLALSKNNEEEFKFTSIINGLLIGAIPGLFLSGLSGFLLFKMTGLWIGASSGIVLSGLAFVINILVFDYTHKEKKKEIIKEESNDDKIDSMLKELKKLKASTKKI